MLTKDDLSQIARIVSSVFADPNGEFQKFKRDVADDFAHIVSAMATKEDLVTLKEEIRAEFNPQISRIIATMTTKEELQEVKKDLAVLRNEVREYTVIADKTAGRIADLQLEYAAVSVQQGRQVDWNHKVGAKVGIPYEY